MKDRDELVQSFLKVAKRIAITIICCLPVLIVVGYLTRNVITNDFLQGLIFVSIMSVAVIIVEVVARVREKRNKAKAILENQKDVFK